jgi:hypothetical protein
VPWIVISICLFIALLVGAMVFAICAIGAAANPNPRADD